MHYWEKFGFFGGHVFLDFINTYDDLSKTRDKDALPTWETVVKWGTSVAILNKKETIILQKFSEINSTSKELEALYKLRELGWKVFRNIAAKKAPAKNDLASMEEVIKWSLQHASIQKDKSHYSWVRQESFLDPALVRVKLGLALNNLLSAENLDRMNECPGCTGLFLNHGRGIGRRWCRMKTCGNRAKTNRFRGI
jgi:predicted RNA-binding Zn ribbon-like protein